MEKNHPRKQERRGKQMVDTSVEFVGIKMSSPFVVASGQHTGEGDIIKLSIEKLVKNRWGGIITKTIHPQCEKGEFPQVLGLRGWRISPHLWTTDEYRYLAMQNSGPGFTPVTKENLKKIRENVKAAHQVGLVVIGNILGRSTLDEWRELGKSVEDTGVDGLELNLGCPTPFTMGGWKAGRDLRILGECVEASRRETSIPIMAKLSSHVTDTVAAAKTCKEAGADSISAINSLRGIIGIDVYSGIPKSSDLNGYGYMSGTTGPLIKPVGLRVVAEIASGVDIPICGIGGISDWKSAVEYMMVGASAVQLCSAVMWHGFPIGKKLYNGLIKFMKLQDSLLHCMQRCSF
jgi:dihydropyrimidine dehydrogenase (NAD+) subunit PreA